ncbi:hypothetical protein ASE74_19535 [Pedobacter sp. Leaf216]|uniref:DUF421 domain-containing protein n=1 Tax=Pedobacter sp. Leaf216 TaxID=1735684 RepID=UPI0006F835D1|nr:DUF421 domain-containing protein [Pedobacter sp. Leaf216]KQM76248.1 hypothetical protein ASE74_19535 [Pedobacter sp. Leaf216]
MQDIDWTKIMVGEEKWGFLVEIAIRTILMYFIILIGLRLLGKRGVRQLSVFEMVVIISLGSAAGDPMFYKEIGLMVPVAIFAIIVSAYRLTTYLMAKSKGFDDLVEGKATYFIEEGMFSVNEFRKETLAQDEFFSELRQQGVSHLGQVKTAILETSGCVSIFFFPDNEVKPGLPILPKAFDTASTIITQDGKYACSFCGKVETISKGQETDCKNCNHNEWVMADHQPRIQ